MNDREYANARRYLDDPIFHNLVSLIEKLMSETKLSPNEFHDAVNVAASRQSVNRYYDLKGVEHGE